MFVSAVSCKGADSTKPDDVGIGNSVGDLTPATFRVEFDEPLRIKNADIELVACKITKKNEIIINAGNNLLSVRMGDHIVGEQYTAKIPHGNYLAGDLADAIAQALNYVMPLNLYKGGFSCSIVANKIKITYTLVTAPDHVPFQEQVKEEHKVIQDGATYPIRTDDALFVKFECSDAQKDQIRGPLRIPTEDYEFCGSLDLGALEPDRQQRTGISEFGIWEGRRGEVTAILRPVNSVIRSSFDGGFGGFDGTTAKPTYMTFEFEQNEAEDGTPVTGLYEYGGMFNRNTMKSNVPREYHPQHHKQINGVLNRAFDAKDTRGSPYNVQSVFHFPYCNNPKVAKSATNSREIYYDKSWSGTIEMRKQAGRPDRNQPAPVPGTYSFQIEDGADAKAVSLAKRRGFKTDKVKIRPSIRTLITGLPQQQVLNGPMVDTLCNIVAPINPSPNNLRYIVGTTGMFNSQSFGANYIVDNTQGLQTGGGPSGVDLYKLPYYKILSINPDGSPLEVCLTDGGEHIIRTSTATPATIIDTSLFLNDPATWFEIVPSGDDEDTIMEEQMVRVTPVANDLGNDSGLENDKEYRFPSFNMGLQRDDLFQLQKNNFPPAPYGSDPNKLLISKDIQIDFFSKLQNTDGTDTPNEGQVQVKCFQLQPTQPNDSSLEVYADIESKKLLFNASSNTWNSKNGNGSTMVNWGAGSFNGVNNANSAIKITIENFDTYTQNIQIGYTNAYVDTTTVFNNGAGVGMTELVRTGVTRGGIDATKMEATQKTRFFPYHPVFSQMPCSIAEKTINYYKCVGTKYPLRNCFYPIDGQSNFQNNYSANLAFMSKGDFNAPQNVFAPTTGLPTSGGPAGEKPVIMIKSQKLEPSQISPGPAPPPAGSTGLSVPEDFTPEEAGSLYNAGLHSIMYAQVGAGSFVDFPQDSIPIKQPFMPSFAVEIQNLPLSGYIGKGFDEGKAQDRRGLGSRLPIVGVVPATEFPESNDVIVNYHYKTPYYQPTQVRLASQTFLYSLDLNLRNLVTGKLLQDLLHSTEVILRIYPLPD